MAIVSSILRGCCLLLTCLPACTADARAEAAFPRVRSVDARVAWLVAQGRRDSPTFAALVAGLRQCDVIVHVEERPPHAGRAMGETQLVARAGGVRYLRVSIRAGLSDESAIALLGHELHHAWEIAQAPWVVDQETLARLYERIGHVHDQGGARRADSAGARQAGTRVLVELRGARAAATH
jgi:hypothetical protein